MTRRARLSIEKLDERSTGSAVYADSPGEINATGKIVYGYNLRVTAAGIYRITFTLPNVNIHRVR